MIDETETWTWYFCSIVLEIWVGVTVCSINKSMSLLASGDNCVIGNDKSSGWIGRWWVWWDGNLVLETELLHLRYHFLVGLLKTRGIQKLQRQSLLVGRETSVLFFSE